MRFLVKVPSGWVAWGALVLLCTFVVPVAFADQTEADSALASAEQEIGTCFEAATKAENVGADITSLTAALSDAGSLLSSARFAYAQGDFDLARDLAVQSRAPLAGFVPAANALIISAVDQRTNEALIGIVGSAVATVIVVALGWVVWGFLKKRSFGGVLDSKPVVEECM